MLIPQQSVEGADWNLSMMDVVRYEQALKQRFLSTISIQPVSPAQAILDELSGPLPVVFERQTKVKLHVFVYPYSIC